jgi:hypothetical protein
MGLFKDHRLLVRAIGNGCVQWLGEAVVGLLPPFGLHLEPGYRKRFLRHGALLADRP